MESYVVLEAGKARASIYLIGIEAPVSFSYRGTEYVLVSEDLEDPVAYYHSRGFIQFRRSEAILGGDYRFAISRVDEETQECRICDRRRLISLFHRSMDVCDSCHLELQDAVMDYEVGYDQE